MGIMLLFYYELSLAKSVYHSLRENTTEKTTENFSRFFSLILGEIYLAASGTPERTLTSDLPLRRYRW